MAKYFGYGVAKLIEGHMTKNILGVGCKFFGGDMAKHFEGCGGKKIRVEVSH